MAAAMNGDPIERISSMISPFRQGSNLTHLPMPPGMMISNGPPSSVATNPATTATTGTATMPSPAAPALATSGSVVPGGTGTIDSPAGAPAMGFPPPEPSPASTTSAFLLGIHNYKALDDVDLPKFVREHQATLTFPEKVCAFVCGDDWEYH